MIHDAVGRDSARPRSGAGVAVVLLAASALTLAALLRLRPHLAGSPASWRGDELALAAAWVLGVVFASWLVLTTIACLAAMTGGRHACAARVAAWGPPVARRTLQLALAGSALVPSAAHAAPAVPITLHAGPGGGLTTISSSTGDDTPVVRAPSTTTTAPLPPPVITITPTTWPPSAGHNPTPLHSPVRIAPPAGRVVERRVRSSEARTYVVRAGDNLWRIAQTEMAHAAGGLLPDNRRVAQYWRRLIAANRATLRSGDPSLIFPGEVVALPRIDH
jgi:nucleoid-associated protein YgaU